MTNRMEAGSCRTCFLPTGDCFSLAVIRERLQIMLLNHQRFIYPQTENMSINSLAHPKGSEQTSLHHLAYSLQVTPDERVGAKHLKM